MHREKPLNHYCSPQMLHMGGLIIGGKNPKIIILKIHEIIGYFNCLIANNYWRFYSYVLPIYFFLFYSLCSRSISKQMQNATDRQKPPETYKAHVSDVSRKISNSPNSSRHMAYREVADC